MVRMDLTEHEAEILTDILEYYLSELRMEISSTDRMDFRENLKAREEVIKKLLHIMEQEPEN